MHSTEIYDHEFPARMRVPDAQTGRPVTQSLGLPPTQYRVVCSDGLWFVTVAATGAFVYAGPGPVELWQNLPPY